MKLTGQVILDDETTRKLTEQIRREIMEDITTRGLRGDETEKYLSECNYKEYISLIRKTIDGVIRNTDLDAPFFEKNTFKTLTVMSDILKIQGSYR